MSGKKGTYREEDYMYSSAKLASMSRSLISADALAGLCSSGDAGRMFDRLGEFGITPVRTDGRPDIESSLTGFLAGRYEELASFLPDAGPCRIMRSRYDCHNLKTAIKCRALGIPADQFFIDCGSISAEKIIQMTDSGDYSELPSAYAAAAAEARRAADSRAPARYSDALLDAACFTDMKECADAFGCEPVSDLLSLKADLTNCVTALRIVRMKNAAAAEGLRTDSFVSGGKISPDVFRAASSRDEATSALSAVLTSDEMDLIPSEDAGIEAAGAAFDRIFLARALSLCRRRLTGIYPVIDYVIRLEYEVKNLRIIYYGLESGKDAGSIGEELRISV